MNPKRNKRRLDVAVAEQASISRERAQALIMAGKVRVDGERAAKAGESIGPDARIEVADDSPFVSRGGVKLERALATFGWSVEGLRCLDVGASTGGFTDCLLQRGASSVTALDVGYGQIAWPLRGDPRVRVVERTNFREVDPAEIGAPFDFACIDVSFISLTKLAARLRESLRPGARLVALVKPQFEAGREAVGRGGVVRDAAIHVFAIESVRDAFARAALRPVHLTYSPIVGPAGNIEFLLGCVADGADGAGVGADVPDGGAIDAAGVVAAAHETLDR